MLVTARHHFVTGKAPGVSHDGMAGAPSVANAVIAGVDYTPPLLVKAARMMGLRRLSLQRHLYLPASLPTFVAA